MNYQTAVFGGGCFWCLETIFLQIKGVESVESGYAGGSNENPTYKEVCSGKTGHAEVVKIDFNPEVISYTKLLEIFFYIHDPTTLNRQGNDIGEQYRSVILLTSPEQEKIAREYTSNIKDEKIYSKPIVTEIRPLEKFYKAEEHHQKYYYNNLSQSYCQMVISPKVKKFKEKFSKLLR
ncbi:MAG: peptide-methionine (S)-S-oxide reductase [Actinobacteria bacterium RBG_13_35_12]|jgi:peptide-methionine (S)-S-oxide reductase|nr:MAG: peptide-methionine (S)-S-oxide reductase [Actinobacteria bacterium RBG_13_35_12]